MEDNDAILAKKLQEEEYKFINEDVDSLALARQLQAEENLENNETPEDPNPDLHGLFIAFDQQYFWGSLTSVEVRWSNKMTLCAGLCCYQAGGYCSIRLSEPLLKFRTRQDMIETLLHEMIHAYLFVTKNYKDHNAHGPEFLKHMERINSAAGTKITVYHNFRDEGPCQYKPPYFGIVQRAMNRPPQPADSWWEKHRQSCGGTYHKIAEPQKEEKKQITKIRKRKLENDNASGSNVSLDKWFRKSVDKELSQTPKFKRRCTDDDSGRESSQNHNQSIGLENDSKEKGKSINKSFHISNTVQCPICGNNTIDNSAINDHIDLCIWASENGEQLPTT
ncbi:22228_t:CDS:2 [Gigaspora margarita]|uniref:Protein with SprT-like domain at the N terminus n=1 Tax=Gigaspora margarita TaxID=4874 RepID=A0ABN7WFD9_GIGMA|nr:22228_t:CDS:2 [Gigaspora margarita]